MVGFPHRVSCHVWRVKGWAPPGRFGCLSFLCVILLQRLRLPILCWTTVARVDIPVMFLTLGGKPSVFPHWRWYWRWVFNIWLLWSWGMILLSLLSWGFLSRKEAVFCQMLSLHPLRGLCGSCPFFYWYDESHCFAGIEPALHPR